MPINTIVDCHEEDGYAVLRVEGSIDASTAADFDAALTPLAGNGKLNRIVLDLGGLKFVASAGLRVLITAVKAMTPRKAKLYVAAVPESVAGVLKMTGFLTLVEIKSTVEECLA